MDADRPGDILDGLLPHVLEPEAELVAYLIMHDARHHDPAGIRQRLEPRGHVDAVAKNVVAIDDDVTDIYTDAEPDATLGRHVGVTLGHATLDVDAAANRIDDADELHQQSVRGGDVTL